MELNRSHQLWIPTASTRKQMTLEPHKGADDNLIYGGQYSPIALKALVREMISKGKEIEQGFIFHYNHSGKKNSTLYDNFRQVVVPHFIPDSRQVTYSAGKIRHDFTAIITDDPDGAAALRLSERAKLILTCAANLVEKGLLDGEKVGYAAGSSLGEDEGQSKKY